MFSLYRLQGRFVWVKPLFTNRFQHALPNGGSVKCVGGTQYIDRFWRTLRAAIVGRSCRVGAHSFERRVRSCRWQYWFKGQDQWQKTGEMLTTMRVNGM